MKATYLASLAPNAEFPSLFHYCCRGCDLLGYLMTAFWVVAGLAVGEFAFAKPWFGLGAGGVIGTLALTLTWAADRDDWEFMRPTQPFEGPI